MHEQNSSTPIAMSTEELEFLEDRLAATELLDCRQCGEQTLHAHHEVLDTFAAGVKLKMTCTTCHNSRTWIDWDTTQLDRSQN